MQYWKFSWGEVAQKKGTLFHERSAGQWYFLFVRGNASHWISLSPCQSRQFLQNKATLDFSRSLTYACISSVEHFGKTHTIIIDLLPWPWVISLNMLVYGCDMQWCTHTQWTLGRSSEKRKLYCCPEVQLNDLPTNYLRWNIVISVYCLSKSFFHIWEGDNNKKVSGLKGIV